MTPRMTSLRRSAVLLAACSLAGTVLPAQESSRSIHPRTPPVAQAAPRTGTITIDGRLDEDAWNTAAPISQLTQSEPHEGQAPTQRTEIRVLYDDEAIYIGARVFDSLGAAGIRAPLARRDQLLDANGNNGSFNSLTTDKIIVMLDPYHNHIDQAWFEINPSGVKGDQFNGDPSWDPIWQSGAHVDSLGWTAEMRIPFSQLRFSRDSVQTWGMQVWRYSDRNNEKDMWAFWRANEAGGPAFFGHLTGLRIGSRPRQFEMLPYVLTGEQYKFAHADDPYHNSSQGKLQAGVDLKYLLTSNLTLDATVNPDFGQVEVDPATINLSAYETYYDEKRPFFVAGSNAFDFGGASCMFCSNFSSLDLFYSRRIGRVPQLNSYVDTRSAFDDTPGTTSILGAAKVTGRTGGGVSVGLLDALTGSETARYLPLSSGPELKQEVEPLSNYFVGRMKKELNEGATTVGGMLTSTVRQLGDSIMTNRLRSHAEAAGFDFSHNWSRRTYRWIGSLALSNVAGSDRLDPAVECALLPAPRPPRQQRRPVRHALRHDRDLAPRLRLLHAPRQGEWRLAVGDGAELAQPGIRGERPLLPRSRRLQVDERQRRPAVHDADALLPEHHGPRWRTAAVQLRRAAHRPAGPVLFRHGVPQLLEPARLRHPSLEHR